MPSGRRKVQWHASKYATAAIDERARSWPKPGLFDELCAATNLPKRADEAFWDHRETRDGRKAAALPFNRTAYQTERSMPRTEFSKPPVRDSRLEREVERERNEHMLNHDAKARLGLDDDVRHKDARETSFSSKVRR
jgi:hypothetical protein